MEKSDKYNRQGFSRIRWGNLLENLFIVILVFYPLRHIGWGLDLWDTGYNYTNFRYLDKGNMDPMWLFSTYLANVVGNWITKLPNAGSLMGMNLDTGLFVSLLALMGYFFCTRKLKMPKCIVFAGELLAISLCWCPTAVVYNYLTYVFFLGASIFLYLGLVKEKRGYLVFAGVMLGANVLVRFSNLPEMALILAVWAWDFLAWKEEKQRSKVGRTGMGRTGLRATEQTGQFPGAALQNRDAGSCEGFWRRTGKHTLWCFTGYAAALLVLLLGIHIRYGIQEYISGVMRLFAMTDNASDYKAASMVMGIVGRYVENLYWVFRMAMIVLGGTVFFALGGWLEDFLLRKPGDRNRILGRWIHVGMRLLWAVASVLTFVWLYSRICSSFFYSYDPILRPGTMFQMLVILIAAIRIFDRNCSKEEKLVSGMLILIIPLTSLGSNNGVLPACNNLFLAAPYALWEIWRFVRYTGDRKIKQGLILSGFPAKGVLLAFVILCAFQFGMFGAKFAFAEATGIQEASTTVDNNEILKNVKMSPEKAEWMTEVSAYVSENELQGREVILYGWIPAMSYYLQMPPAFNPWSDLTSYGYEYMEAEIRRQETLIQESGAEKPVILLENIYALYEEGGMEALEEGGIPESKRMEVDRDPKWELLMHFMDSQGYDQTFRNEKFAMYQIP